VLTFAANYAPTRVAVYLRVEKHAKRMVTHHTLVHVVSKNPPYAFVSGSTMSYYEYSSYPSGGPSQPYNLFAQFRHVREFQVCFRLCPIFFDVANLTTVKLDRPEHNIPEEVEIERHRGSVAVFAYVTQSFGPIAKWSHSYKISHESVGLTLL
jgi:hypothetical protein